MSGLRTLGFLSSDFRNAREVVGFQYNNRKETIHEQDLIHLAKRFLEAAKKGQKDTVERLYNSCPDLIHVVDEEGNSALHLAAQQAKDQVVSYLVRSAKMPVNLKNYQGDTPLNLSAQAPLLSVPLSNRIQVLSFLMANKADPEISNLQGKTTIMHLPPLRQAVESKYPNLIKDFNAVLKKVKDHLDNKSDLFNRPYSTEKDGTVVYSKTARSQTMVELQLHREASCLGFNFKRR